MDILSKINALSFNNQKVEDLKIISGAVGKDGIYYVTLQSSTRLQSLEDQISAACDNVKVRFVYTQTKPQEQKPTLAAKHVIYVVSGKGGVGKSTIAASLAMVLQQHNFKVGLLDADIYGPSLPTLFDLYDLPETDQGKIIPHQSDNLQLMSMGFLISDSQPLAWRGLMLQKAINQLLFDVNWGARGELDFLVVDTPPGTGDVHLTLAKNIDIASSAIVISTPQRLAQADAKRAHILMEKLDIPVRAKIENMCALVCSSCGHEQSIFPKDNTTDNATTLPLDCELATAADHGKLAEYFKHDSFVKQKLTTLAREYIVNHTPHKSQAHV